MREHYRGFVWGWDGSVQDMVVEAGRVAYRGAPLGHVADAVLRDRSGSTLFPAYIDNHCHILPCGLDLMKLNLGACSTREEVLDAVRSRLDSVPTGEWLMAVHYDQTKYSDQRHLTRKELDGVCKDRPILLRHVSGHASVANSAALRAAGVDEDVADPEGGRFERDSSGRLTGVLLETAHEAVTAASPDLSLDQMVEAIRLAADSMSGFGIACASDMMTGRFDLDLELQAYRIAAERGSPVRFRLYLQWARVFGRRAIARERLDELVAAMNPETCNVAGIKIFADGAIGSATAAIYGKFASNPEGPDDQGQLIYSAEKLKEMVRIADQAGYQIAIHSIGDRSTDLVMEAYEQLPQPSRHRIEHAMILSDAQIERMARLGCHVTMQPEFLHRFGHTYRAQLGPERAARLKRFRSVANAGLRLSLSSDNPIVQGDPALGWQTASRRPDGFDPTENLTREEALQGYGPLAAAANEDAGLMGSLLPGELADLRWAE